MHSRQPKHKPKLLLMWKPKLPQLMKRYNFFLPEQIVDAPRKEAERTGVTMSELIRRILMDGLGKHE